MSTAYTYVPSPTASLLLSRLIEFNYAPDPLPEDLPPEWLHAAREVLKVADFGRRARFVAFVEACRNYSYDMVEELNHVTQTYDDTAEHQPIFYSASDALHDPPQREWLVEPLFTLPSLNLLVGPPGAKKTLLAIDLAVCLALGRPWLQHSLTQSPVLIVDEETGLNRLWGRLHASLRAHHAGHDTPLHFVSLGGFDLRQPQDAETLTHRALAFNARLIIIDTLTGVMRGGDENSVPSVQPLLYHLRRLAEYCHAAVLVLHHTNRHGAVRGSSSIAAAADLMLSIESPADSPLIQLRALKTRHAVPPPFQARAHFETSPDGVAFTWLTPTDKTPPPRNLERPGAASAILQLLAQRRQATFAQLVAALPGNSPGTLRNVLHQLIHSGQLIRQDGGSKGARATFALPPSAPSPAVKAVLPSPASGREPVPSEPPAATREVGGEGASAEKSSFNDPGAPHHDN